MARIEEYAVIGDMHTAALVARNGSIDWLCLPRFDSPAAFAALLGDERNGHWTIAPAHAIHATRRRYRPGSLVLETEFDTAEGTVRLVDCMALRDGHGTVIRIVEGVHGCVPMKLELVLRFDYGQVAPWVRKIEGIFTATAGPDAVEVRTPVDLAGENMRTVAEFTVSADARIPFTLTYFPSHKMPPPVGDPFEQVERADQWWRAWSQKCRYDGPYRDAVVRSLLTLKALSYEPTGAIVAAVTTSLPEEIGGDKNWDYRFCWLRDATFSLAALMSAGYTDEARAWRDWLLRAFAGNPRSLQVLYGLAGERRIVEWELSELAGYEGSKPVRIGNAASGQFQLDVYGEIIESLHQAHVAGLPLDETAWQMSLQLLDYLEAHWQDPGSGIWEFRATGYQCTESKVFAWVAFDRAVRFVEQCGFSGPVERWRLLRDQIHDDVCRKGYDPYRQTFTQSYGSKTLDAATLLIPLVGFLPADDPRMRGTIAAIERHLVRDGFVYRYDSDFYQDDRKAEGAFLACNFWLADNYLLCGRRDDAVAQFERCLSIANDVGLLAEEYDTARLRQVGNFPQAFSHVGLVNTAFHLAGMTSGRRRQPPDGEAMQETVVRA